MPLGNIIGTAVIVLLAMAGINRFKITRRLAGTDASP